MSEEVFFERGDIKVTSARVIFGAQTYALSGVTSVRNTEIKPEKLWPIILIVVGLFLCVIPSIIGIIWLVKMKTEYAVTFATAGGEVRAFTSQDGALVTEIVNAINNAIVHRG